MGETCLLVGAGAEVGLDFPSVPKYLLDTYFNKKPKRYGALTGKPFVVLLSILSHPLAMV